MRSMLQRQSEAVADGQWRGGESKRRAAAAAAQQLLLHSAVISPPLFRSTFSRISLLCAANDDTPTFSV